MSDKNKLNNQSGDYREEMEELARIFKEELDKTIEESENTETETEYEVEGYEVTMGEKKPVEELTEDELCVATRMKPVRSRFPLPRMMRIISVMVHITEKFPQLLRPSLRHSGSAWQDLATVV